MHKGHPVMKHPLISLLILALAVALAADARAVTTAVTRHARAADFVKGTTRDTVIDSQGAITLASVTAPVDLGPLLRNVWTINALVADNTGALYLGTSPNGDIIRYSDGQAKVLYTAAPQNPDEDPDASEPFANEHVFALALDSQNRLLAGISGSSARLLRISGDNVETIFSDPDVAYSFAIVIDSENNIYLGTGPNGLIFKIDASNDARRICDLRDNSILSLALADDGTLYAGSDQRGLVYRIDPDTNTAAVLYDADQDEITALLLNPDGSLYAAATSAQAVKEHVKAQSIVLEGGEGRPDTDPPAPKEQETATLEVANTAKPADAKPAPSAPETPKGALPKTAGRIYRIDSSGFVTDVFAEAAVFYALARKDNRLLLATGNDGRLFTIDPETEEKAVAYEDKQSAQITALALAEGAAYLACANPPQLIRLEDAHVARGTYTSPLIDAGAPARWGALQINAEIPRDTSIRMSARTGNVGEPNDPTFSPWSDPVLLTAATQLDVPNGRFCQYRLTFETARPTETPRVREVAVAHVIPNIPPRVTAARTARLADKARPGLVVIAASAVDENKDTLTFTIDFRQVGRTRWIQLAKDLTAPKYEWDTRTVADGRYEVRVTASDRRSNTEQDAMTGSRISDPFVVDNTPPEVEYLRPRVEKRTATIDLKVRDEYTAIGSVHYTLDSNDNWIAALPDDSVFDTTTETITIRIDDLEPGPHVLALKIADDLENTVYKTLDLTIK